jgi:hypothetical protein
MPVSNISLGIPFLSLTPARFSRSDLAQYRIGACALELVRKEQDREHNSTAVRKATNDTMIEYLMLGVEIEGQQCVSVFWDSVIF